MNLVWHLILFFHWRLLYDHWVLDSLILFFCFNLNLFAWWLSELSELVPIHSLPLMRTSLHLDLRNLIKGLFLALSNDKVVWNIPNHSISNIFTEVIWWSPASKLSSLQLLLIHGLSQVELDYLLWRPLSSLFVLISLDTLHHLDGSDCTVPTVLLLHLEVMVRHHGLTKRNWLVIILCVDQSLLDCILNCFFEVLFVHYMNLF